MNIKTITTKRHISDEGFEFTFKPVDDSVTITKTKSGYEARYLVQDENAESPQENSDDTLFLVGFHRDFYVLPPGTKRGTGQSDSERFNEAVSKYKETHFIFALEAYIHSGVVLALSQEGNFPDRQWDVSQLGAVFVAKEHWKTKKNARHTALSHIEMWNSYLSGDVYGIVKETYDKDKKQLDNDACWGYFGYKYALEALKTDI